MKTEPIGHPPGTVETYRNSSQVAHRTAQRVGSFGRSAAVQVCMYDWARVITCTLNQLSTELAFFE